MYSYVSIDQIKKEYHLDVLCPQNTAQKENIALTIKGLYYYYSKMKELEGIKDDELKVINRKVIMTLSYTVIDGIVACLGFKIQNRCYNCKKRCSNYSNSMFRGDIKENENKSFKNADDFLRKVKIINLNKSDDNFYKGYREIRNNIHLTKNTNLITEDNAYSKNYVDRTIKFMNDFIDMLYHNYNYFLNINHCTQKEGK